MKKISYSEGFTLIEIMVTIAIMAIAAIVVLPNFKNLGKSQQLANSINDVIGAFHSAQSNAQSGAICDNGSSSKFWAVSLLPSGYSVWASCADGTLQPATIQAKNLAPGLAINTPTVATNTNPINTCYLAFQGTQIAESAGCKQSDGITPDTTLHTSGKLTIKIYNSGSCYNKVVIESGGAIYASPCP